MSLPDPKIKIYKMQHADIDAVLEIERSCFASAWSRISFETELDKPYGVSFSVFYEDTLIGYAIGWVITDEIHIANLAVAKAYRKKGIGKCLVRRLIEVNADVRGAFLEVRKSNKAALTLYKKMGFEPIGIRKNYYIEDNEDAVLMRKDLLVSAE